MDLMQPIRLILTSNSTYSLFMAAYLKDHPEGFQSLVVSCLKAVDQDYAENLAEKLKTLTTVSIAPFEKSIPVFHFLPERDRRYRFSIRNLWGALQEKRSRSFEIEKMKKFLFENQIDPRQVKEIWFGNAHVATLLKAICPQAKVFEFEHGISGMRSAIEYQTIDQCRFRDRLYQKIENFFLYFSLLRPDAFVSVLSEELLKIRPDVPILSISQEKVIEFGMRALKEDPIHQWKKLNPGPAALILMSNIKPWAKNLQDHQDYVEASLQNIYQTYHFLFEKLGIQHVILKGQLMQEDKLQEAFVQFQKKFSFSWKMHWLTDYSPSNFPVEYYLPLLQPKILIGTYSSGLIYGKKLFPEMLTFTDDLWFQNYCIKKFGQTFSDFKWMRPMFKTHEFAFKGLLPAESNEHLF